MGKKVMTEIHIGFLASSEELLNRSKSKELIITHFWLVSPS
jgi:hypothetical protein